MATFTSPEMDTTNEYIKYKIIIKENSQNIANNTTNVTVSMRFYRTNSGYSSYGTGTAECEINGTWYKQSITSSQKITESGIVLFSKTLNITHETNGAKYLRTRGHILHDVVNSSTQSYNVNLTAIPRASSLTASNGTLGTSQTLTINRYSSNFTHTITYTCGAASGTIATKTTSTSVAWTPPLSLASQNTTGTTVSVEFEITTYYGNTAIGTATKTITCSMPASIKPSCSFKLTDINDVDDIYGSPVQGLSQIEVDVTATESYGAAVEKCVITIDGATYYDFSIVSEVLKNSGDSVVTAVVTDERGRTGSVSYTMKVQPYTPPNVSKLVVHRVAEDGTESDQGEYIHVSFSAAISSMSSKNTADYVLKYKQSTQTDYTEIEFPDLSNVYTVTNREYQFAADSGHSYNVVIEATDRHSTTAKATTASTAFTIMNFHSAGTGIAFGKVSERMSAIEFGLDMFDQYGAEIGNGVAAYRTGGVHIDPDTTMEHVCITNVNTPKSDFWSSAAFWYIVTYFYNGKTSGTNRMQVAYPYSADLPVHYRHRYLEEWSDWRSPGESIILFDGAWQMTGEELLEYPDGIEPRYMSRGLMLTFSPALSSGGTSAEDSNFEHRFVDKAFINDYTGKGTQFTFMRFPAASLGCKYLYFYKNAIGGNYKNLEKSTGGLGLPYDNGAWLLRRVTAI